MICTIAVFTAGILVVGLSLPLPRVECWALADAIKSSGYSVRVERHGEPR